jgi:hypothetical protein
VRRGRAELGEEIRMWGEVLIMEDSCHIGARDSRQREPLYLQRTFSQQGC